MKSSPVSQRFPEAGPLRLPSKVAVVIERSRRLFKIIGAFGILAAAGCQAEPASSSAGATTGSAAVKSSVVADSGPSVVELQKADAFVDAEGIARFEIHYKFTSGAPTRHYLCNIVFPNIDRTIAKFMSASELSQEGAFKTAIEAGETPPDAFEVVLSEAESPDAGFQPISNTLAGPILKLAAADKPAP
ncbi:hypothetical protein [Planctellipticum variicoloris]|uniref:hypothetical protein n=1 Tax=Planctellipticum variicoloris TaxID=3064265 RepID=UPI00301321E8|nr:hypothetical protein SH412_003923 [Planctomycetaceae bacterium SH412]